MLTELPMPVVTYLDADGANDADTLAKCFSSDACVRDEGHEYCGPDAIKSWKQDLQKQKYDLEPLDSAVEEDSVKLHALLTGEFPGSPVEVDYTFTLADDKITSLAIG